MPVAKELAQEQVLPSFLLQLLFPLSFGSSSKILLLLGCRRYTGRHSFPLPCPIPTALASQPGSPCSPRDMPPVRMLCEVSSRFLAYAVVDTPLKYLPVRFFVLKESMGLDFHGSHQSTFPLQFLSFGLNLGPSSVESQPCWQWECLVWVWLRL